MNRVDILVPSLPESISNAVVITWHKNPGDNVNRNEVLVEIETDKVILEIPALVNGTLDTILEKEGSIVTPYQILGYLTTENTSNKKKDLTLEEKTFVLTPHHQTYIKEQDNSTLDHNISCSTSESYLNYTTEAIEIDDSINSENTENNLSIDQIETLRENSLLTHCTVNSRNKKRVPMNNLRQRIAERMLEAKNSTAMLTTFNEINMKSIINLRQQYGEIFEKRYNIRLGFMSFYVKAVVEALKRYPEINASIEGNDIVYYNYFDISIAISTSRGLVTPVIHNANMLSIANIEKQIKSLTLKSRNGKLTIDDLSGGNFTITNSGIFGSLFSTPIINPPQSAILGIHAIKDRPMAIDKEIKILPMMYLALSYDHRLIDGRESIGFLTVIKDLLEDPLRLLLEI